MKVRGKRTSSTSVTRLRASASGEPCREHLRGPTRPHKPESQLGSLRGTGTSCSSSVMRKVSSAPSCPPFPESERAPSPPSRFSFFPVSRLWSQARRKGQKPEDPRLLQAWRHTALPLPTTWAEDHVSQAFPGSWELSQTKPLASLHSTHSHRSFHGLNA